MLKLHLMTKNGPENDNSDRPINSQPLGANRETHRFLVGMGKSSAPRWGDKSFTNSRTASVPNPLGTSAERRARAYDGVNSQLKGLKKTGRNKKIRGG